MSAWQVILVLQWLPSSFRLEHPSRPFTGRRPSTARARAICTILAFFGRCRERGLWGLWCYCVPCSFASYLGKIVISKAGCRPNSVAALVGAVAVVGMFHGCAFENSLRRGNG